MKAFETEYLDYLEAKHADVLASLKAGKYTGMGEYELDVTYIKNTKAPLSTEEIKILKQ